MKTIGIIGGMSWESTRTYYELINSQVKQSLGGLHSAKIVLISIDFAELEAMQARGDWDAAAELMVDAAKKLELTGADFFMIATNTMHKVAEQVQAAVSIPLLHIATATGEALVRDKRQRVALLGTRFTMEQDFYTAQLQQRFGLDVLIPSAPDRDTVHNVIYNELCLGRIESRSRQQYQAIIDRLVQRGAECVILGCTEISLLISPTDVQIPVYDTTAIHAKAATELALS